METRLFFIGDSFVNGTGDPEALGWVGRVCAAVQASGRPITFYNLGIRGNTTAQILQRWRTEVEARLAPGSKSCFVFSFGANDVTFSNQARRLSHAESLDHARHLLTTAQALGPVLMVGSPPIADDTEANQRLSLLCNDLSNVCEELAIPFVHTLQRLLSTSTWMEEAIAHDGAHPGAAGYQALADLLLRSPTWQIWISSLFATD